MCLYRVFPKKYFLICRASFLHFIGFIFLEGFVLSIVVSRIPDERQIISSNLLFKYTIGPTVCFLKFDSYPLDYAIRNTYIGQLLFSRIQCTPVLHTFFSLVNSFDLLLFWYYTLNLIFDTCLVFIKTYPNRLL